MREIKFRGRRKDNGEWAQGWYLQSNTGDHLIASFDKDGMPQLFEVHPETVGQYVGLKDKNGVEICEGDIFEAPHDFGPSGFHARRAAVHWHNNVGYQWIYWLLDELKVIGNRWEHPKLLEPEVNANV